MRNNKEMFKDWNGEDICVFFLNKTFMSFSGNLLKFWQKTKKLILIFNFKFMLFKYLHQVYI